MFETAGGMAEPPEQRCRDGEGGIGDNLEGPTRQSQISGVSLDDDERLSSEVFSELGGTTGVKLEGHDLRASRQERPSDSAGTCANVEHEVAGFDPGTCDESLGPAAIELVPPPEG